MCACRLPLDLLNRVSYGYYQEIREPGVSYHGAYCEIPGDIGVKIRKEGGGSADYPVCQLWLSERRRQGLDPPGRVGVNPLVFSLQTTTYAMSAVP